MSSNQPLQNEANERIIDTPVTMMLSDLEKLERQAMALVQMFRRLQGKQPVGKRGRNANQGDGDTYRQG